MASTCRHIGLLQPVLRHLLSCWPAFSALLPPGLLPLTPRCLLVCIQYNRYTIITVIRLCHYEHHYATTMKKPPKAILLQGSTNDLLKSVCLCFAACTSGCEQVSECKPNACAALFPGTAVCGRCATCCIRGKEVCLAPPYTNTYIYHRTIHPSQHVHLSQDNTSITTHTSITRQHIYHKTIVP